jgi:N-methylhydantoinase A
LRYVHQGYELTVRLSAVCGAAGLAPLTAADLDDIERRFHEEHERQYAWSSPNLAVELVNLGVTALGRLPRLALRKREPVAANAQAVAHREVCFGGQIGRVHTPVFDFDQLGAGWCTAGPAVIEQRFSTVLVLPGHRARMDDYGNILMEASR